MKINFYSIIGVVYILFFVGAACFSVGQVPDCNQPPYSWWLPAAVFGDFFVLFVLGYCAGWRDQEVDDSRADLMNRVNKIIQKDRKNDGRNNGINDGGKP